MRIRITVEIIDDAIDHVYGSLVTVFDYEHNLHLIDTRLSHLQPRFSVDVIDSHSFAVLVGNCPQRRD